MKNYLFLLLLLPILFSTSYATDLTGIWYGHGELKNRNRKIPCEIYMNLSQTQSKFSIVAGGYICDDYNVEYPSSSFDIVDNNLYYQGILSGELIDGGVLIFSEFDRGQWFYLTLRKSSKGISYHERWEVPGSELDVYSNSLQLQ
jgi:hypothetical protein